MGCNNKKLREKILTAYDKRFTVKDTSNLKAKINKADKPKSKKNTLQEAIDFLLHKGTIIIDMWKINIINSVI